MTVLTDNEELIASALLSARIVRPYYARAIAALTPVVCPGLGTVAVDKAWRLYYDPVWLESLSPAHRGAVIGAHEVEHLLRDHCSRAKAILVEPVNHKAWNVCCDAEINDDALPDELPLPNVHPKNMGWIEGRTAEDYYRDLDVVNIQSHTCGGGSGAGTPKEWELGDNESVTGVDDVAAEVLRDAVASDVRDHLKTHGRGSVPVGVAIWAEARAIKVHVSWRALLQRAVRASVVTTTRGRVAWSPRPARRQREGQPLRPGTARVEPTIGVVVDTSGSMGNDGDVVMGAMATLRGVSTKLSVVMCDAAVTGRTARIPKRWLGGGGTDLRIGIDAVKECDVLVVITDGDTPWPDVIPSHTIVLCTTDHVVPTGCPVVRLNDLRGGTP